MKIKAFGNIALDTFKDFHNIYNSTFTQEQIVLEPYGNAITVMTINMAQDCQSGRYLFYVGHSSSDTGLGVNVDDALTVFVLPK